MNSDCGCSSRFNEDGTVVMGLHDYCEKHSKEFMSQFDEGEWVSTEDSSS